MANFSATPFMPGGGANYSTPRQPVKSNAPVNYNDTTKNLGGAGNVYALEGQSKRPSGEQDNNGYGFGYQTDFTHGNTGGSLVVDPTGKFVPSQTYSGGSGMLSGDPDVRRAQALQNELDNAVMGKSPGTDQGSVAAQIKALQARIGLKNQLGSAISTNPDEEGRAVNNQREIANNALSSGLKNTRQNYNSRGLLYSGLREGGEAGIKNQVGLNMASNIAGTKRDYESTLSKEKQAYTSLGFAQQQQNLELANQAFETTMKNNIARNQAYEQLGYGVGSLVGTGYSYANRQQSPQQTPQQMPQQTQNDATYDWMRNPSTGTSNTPIGGKDPWL